VTTRISLLAAAASLLLLLVVFELIRSRRLRERYALLWLATGFSMLALSLWKDGLDTIAGAIGIHYPPSALFVLGSLFIIVVLLHYSTVISRLSDETVDLAQRLALLEAELRRRPVRDDVLEVEDPDGNGARVGSGAVEERRPVAREGERRHPAPVGRAGGQLDRD
jgi:hypothetical protein